MTENLEQLIMDMIIYFDHRIETKSENFLLKAEISLGRDKVYSRALNLYSWINPINHNLPDFNIKMLNILDEEVMEKEDFEEVYSEYEYLFENVPELQSLFELKESFVKFNSALSEDEIKFIYDFIIDHYSPGLESFQLRRR